MIVRSRLDLNLVSDRIFTVTDINTILACLDRQYRASQNTSGTLCDIIGLPDPSH
jgi:hypothetical protein